MKSKYVLKNLIAFFFVLVAASNMFLFLFRQPLWIDFPESREFVIKDSEKNLVVMSFYNDFYKNEENEYEPIIGTEFSHQVKIKKLFPTYYELGEYEQDVYKNDSTDRITTETFPSILEQTINVKKTYNLESDENVYSGIKLFDGVYENSFKERNKNTVTVDYPENCTLTIKSSGDFIEYKSKIAYFKTSNNIEYRFSTSCKTL